MKTNLLFAALLSLSSAPAFSVEVDNLNVNASFMHLGTCAPTNAHQAMESRETRIAFGHEAYAMKITAADLVYDSQGAPALVNIELDIVGLNCLQDRSRGDITVWMASSAPALRESNKVLLFGRRGFEMKAETANHFRATVDPTKFFEKDTMAKLLAGQTVTDSFLIRLQQDPFVENTQLTPPILKATFTLVPSETAKEARMKIQQSKN